MVASLANDITGIILVGGQSRRMGRDKAFLKVDGVPIVERVLEVFGRCFGRVLLIGNIEERLADYGLPVLADVYPGSSLGGLYTGLLLAETHHVFVSSCDLPFPNAEIVRYFSSLKSGFDAVVLRTDEGFEPLFALYSKSCLPAIKDLLDSGNCCAYAYYPQIHVRYVAYEEIAHLDVDGRAFMNVNTPEEFLKTGGEL